MTENTETPKSFSYSTEEQAKHQDQILKAKIGDQDEVISKLTKAIADSQFELNLAIQYKDLLLSQLSGKSESANSIGPSAPSKEQYLLEQSPKRQHRNYQKTLIVEVLKENSASTLTLDGLRIPDIKSLIHEKDKDIKISPNTIGHLLNELIDESLAICTTPPEQTRHRRFKISQLGIDAADLIY